MSPGAMWTGVSVRGSPVSGSEYMTLQMPDDRNVLLYDDDATFSVCSCGLPLFQGDGDPADDAGCIPHHLLGRAEHAYVVDFGFGLMLTRWLWDRIDRRKFTGVYPFEFP
jgi:hypothetical protein